MTATTADPVRQVTSPAQTARRILWAVLLLNVVVLEVLIAIGGRSANWLLGVADFFGLHAALIMMLQLVLVSRLPWLDRRIGMDRLTAWHPWVGFTLLWCVVLHAVFVVLGIGAVSARAARRRLWYETWHALHLSLYAAVLLGLVHRVLEGTTFRYRRLRRPTGSRPGPWYCSA